MIYDDTFTYTVRGYFFVPVKYITVKYEYRQIKIAACSFHSYLAFVQEKTAPFYNGYQFAKKISRSQQLWRY